MKPTIIRVIVQVKYFFLLEFLSSHWGYVKKSSSSPFVLSLGIFSYWSVCGSQFFGLCLLNIKSLLRRRYTTIHICVLFNRFLCLFYIFSFWLLFDNINYVEAFRGFIWNCVPLDSVAFVTKAIIMEWDKGITILWNKKAQDLTTQINSLQIERHAVPNIFNGIAKLNGKS